MPFALCSRGEKEQSKGRHLGGTGFDPSHYFVYHCSYASERCSSHGSPEILLVFHIMY